MIDLYVEGYIGICLDKIKNGIHETITIFNVVTNYFNIFYSNLIDNILNDMKRKVAILLRKLKGKRMPSKVKKVLG